MSKIKDKERILKIAREKKLITYKGIPKRVSEDFSAETLKARKEWDTTKCSKKELPTKNTLPGKAFPQK